MAMRSWLFVLFFLPGILLNGQGTVPTCQPDTTIADTLYGVFPLPYSPTRNPLGGISDTACLNTYFQFVFTLRIPEAFVIPNVGSVPINTVSMHPDTAVANLPAGLDYVCNPPNCIFPKASEGCIILFGTPTNPQDVKVHDLKIRGLLSSFIPIPITFPDSTFFAPGNYFLHIQPAGSPACTPSSVSELAATRLQLRNVPNPFSSTTDIEVISGIRGRFDFRVFDFTGNMIHREPVQIFQGENRISFNGSNLPNGIYIYTLTDGLTSVSRKMVLHR